MFYEKYVRLCNSVNKSPSAVALEIGIAKPTVSRWRNGCEPRDSTLLKVADYFHVSVADLTEEKEKSPTPDGVGLDEETMELWEAWNSGSEAREFLLHAARMVKERRNK